MSCVITGQNTQSQDDLLVISKISEVRSVKQFLTCIPTNEKFRHSLEIHES